MPSVPWWSRHACFHFPPRDCRCSSVRTSFHTFCAPGTVSQSACAARSRCWGRERLASEWRSVARRRTGGLTLKVFRRGDDKLVSPEWLLDAWTDQSLSREL